MTHRPDMQSAVERLIQALTGGDADAAPLAADVSWGGPLQPEPLQGETAVRGHLAALAPFLARVDLRRALYDGDSAALVLAIEGINGVAVEGTQFLRIEDGRIREIRAYFDTAPLLRGGNAR